MQMVRYASRKGSQIFVGRTALGNLWPTADDATRGLMIDFYKGLLSPDVSKADTLRRAQAAPSSIDPYSHPFYWAPFTLVNDRL